MRGILSRRWDLSARPTAGPGDATALSRAAVGNGHDVVFAWGGDGTVREVAAGLLGSTTALGVLPGGTFNVVALALGLPRADPARSAEMLLGARAAPRDAGLMGAEPFLMQATFGLDGFLMHHLSADRKARFGMAGSLWDGLLALFRYDFPLFDVLVDGAPYRVSGAGFVNMTEYAGRYQFVPGARWDDGQGHVLLYSGRTRWSAIGFAVALGFGRHDRRPDVRILPARELTIVPGEAWGQIDGDPWKGGLPVTCRLATEKIQVLIPTGAARADDLTTTA